MKFTENLPGISSALQLTHLGDINEDEKRTNSDPGGEAQPWEREVLRAELRAPARAGTNA